MIAEGSQADVTSGLHFQPINTGRKETWALPMQGKPNGSLKVELNEKGKISSIIGKIYKCELLLSSTMKNLPFS